MRRIHREPGSPGTGPDINPSPDDTEPQNDAEGSPEDQQNRLRDAEILGKSVKVRLAIDNGVTHAIAGTQEKVAKLKNVFSSPFNTYHRIRQEAAEDKYQKKLGNVGTSHMKWRNNHHTKVAAKYKAKLDKRNDKLNSHTAMMQGRLDKVQGIRDKHESIHTRKIEAFRDRKETAQGRKEIRRLRNKLNDTNRSRSEVNLVISGISPEKRKQLGSIACQKEVAQRGMKSLENAKDRAKRKVDGTNEELNTVRESFKTKSEAFDSFTKQRNSADELCTGFSGRINELETERDSLLDSNNPDNDARLAEIETELEREKDGLEAAELQFSNAESKIDALSDSLTYLAEEGQRLTAKSAKQTSYSDGLSSHFEKRQDHVSDINQQQRSAYRAATAVSPTPIVHPPTPDPAADPDTN